jgi:uncharacterized protein (TIGR03000 family)
VNGAPSGQDGAIQVFTSPPLKVGETFRFAVAARWTEKGAEYEWERTVTLEAGQRSRILVASGFKVAK